MGNGRLQSRTFAQRASCAELARGRWKAAPYGAKISIDIASLTAGEALTPAGAFALGQIGGILVDVAHKAVDSKVEENIDAIQWD